MIWPLVRRVAGLFVLLALASFPVEGAPVAGFSGYTRPGSNVQADPTSDFDKKFAARLDDPKDPGLGVTVYFMVADRVDGRVNDPWGLGTNFPSSIWHTPHALEGVKEAPKLDTNARYLYLYQIINDSGEPTQIKSATIRLLVDLDYITSWGWASEGTTRRDRRSLGFGMKFSAEKDREPIRALSALSPGVADPAYRPTAPALAAPSPYNLMGIKLGDSFELTSEGRGREPEFLRLLRESSDPFGEFVAQSRIPAGGNEKPRSLFRPIVPALPKGSGTQLIAPFQALTERGAEYDSFAPVTLIERNKAVLAKLSDRPHPWVEPLAALLPVAQQGNRAFPAVQVFWLDAPLKPGERSGVFGFTTDLPPVYDKVCVRANRFTARVDVASGAPDVRVTTHVEIGTVPVPIPPLLSQPVPGEKEPEKHEQEKRSGPPLAETAPWQVISAFAFGILFLVAILILANAFSEPTPFQYNVFRIILASAAAGFAAMIPGLLSLELHQTTGFVLRAAGALAVFSLVYFLNPAQYVVPPRPPTTPGPNPNPTP
jgi:hypothetical protein